MSTPEKQFKYDIVEYATKVVVALVKSPLYNELETHVFDEELRAYFSEPRLSKLHDYVQTASHQNPCNF